MMRKLLTAGMAAMLVLTLSATAASAKPKTTAYAYTATIDCGRGSVTVGSTDDLFAPLVDLRSGKRYQPVAWDVVVDGRAIQAVKPGPAPKRPVACSYDDGVAVGTVFVKKR
jgi:hypothetical protein